MKKRTLIALAAIVATTTAGCSSGSDGGSPLNVTTSSSHVPSPAPSPSVLSTTADATPTTAGWTGAPCDDPSLSPDDRSSLGCDDSDAPSNDGASTRKPGIAATIETEDGSFDIKVGKPLATAKYNGLWVGLPITVSNVTGTPRITAGNFAISPVDDPDFGNVSTGSVDDYGTSINRTACAGKKTLDVALEDAGMLSDGIEDGMDLSSDLKPTTGCVVFSYEQTDHPTAVGYYLDDSLYGDGPPVAEWAFAPSSRTVTPPRGTVYAISSDGSIGSITYSTRDGQEQLTHVSGHIWTKNVGGTTIAVVTAQAGGGASKISCSITIDGEKVATHTSRGAYAVVTCSATDD